MHEVVVIASCTKRKKVIPDASLCMRNVRADTVVERFGEWVARYASARPTNRARDLYAGDHWSRVRNIEIQSKSATWVCSAGLGLIRADAMVAPYSATFSRFHPDSTAQAGDVDDARRETDEWWRALRDWNGPEEGTPRSVSEIVRRNANARIVIIAAGEYLRVMAPDILEAANDLRSRSHLTIFSADARDSEEFREFVVPITADLTTVLGGSLHSLNARVAERAFAKLGEAPAERQVFLDIVEELVDASEKRIQHNRSPLTDEEVSGFIRAVLARDPRAKKTRVLRELRDSGRACEQKRFGNLFTKVVSSTQ